MSQRKAGAILGYLLLLVKNVIALLFLPFMLHMLGQSEYGLYQLVGSLSAYLSVLDMGLSTTVARYVARYRAHGDEAGQQHFVSLILIIYAVLACLVMATGLALYRYLPTLFSASLTPDELGKAQTMWLVVVASAAITVLTNGFRGICTAYERFVFLRAQDIAQQLLRVGVLFALLSAGYDAVAIVVTDLVLNALFAAFRIGYTFASLHVRLHLRLAAWHLRREVGAFAFFVFLNAIVDQLYWKTGNVIVGVFTNTSLVAVYSIGLQISTLYMALSTAVSGVLLPQTVTMVESNASGAQLTDLMIRYGRMELLVLGLVLTGFFSFGREFISLWVGPGYEAAYWVAIIVMVPLSVPLIQNVGISILQAKNKHRFRSLMYLGIALLNLVTSTLLVRATGILGAAWAAAIGLTLGNIVVINVYYHRVIGLDIPRFFRDVSHGTLATVVVMLLLGVGLNHLVPDPSWGGLVLKAALFASCYAVGMWFGGMNRYERGILRGLVLRGRTHVAVHRPA